MVYFTNEPENKNLQYSKCDTYVQTFKHFKTTKHYNLFLKQIVNIILTTINRNYMNLNLNE